MALKMFVLVPVISRIVLLISKYDITEKQLAEKGVQDVTRLGYGFAAGCEAWLCPAGLAALPAWAMPWFGLRPFGFKV